MIELQSQTNTESHYNPNKMSKNPLPVIIIHNNSSIDNNSCNGTDMDACPIAGPNKM